MPKNINDTGSRLRARFFDSNEPFMSGGHQILKERRNIHRKYQTPAWLMETGLKARLRKWEFLEKQFPLWETSKSQQRSMMLWAMIIYQWFIMNLTAQAVVDNMDEFKRSPNAELFEWDVVTRKSIELTIKRIQNVLAGLRTDGKPHASRKPGRPPKNGTPDPVYLEKKNKKIEHDRFIHELFKSQKQERR